MSGEGFLDHQLYDDIQAKLEEDVYAGLEEAESLGEYTREEIEAMYYKWLQRYHPITKE